MEEECQKCRKRLERQNISNVPSISDEEARVQQPNFEALELLKLNQTKLEGNE